MQKLLRDSSWVKRERSARRPIDFRLDTAQPGKHRRSAEGGMRTWRHCDDGIDDTCGKTERARNLPRGRIPRRDYPAIGSRRAGALERRSTRRRRFQHPQWLEAWYGAFAGNDDVEPLMAVVTDARDRGAGRACCR